MSNLTIDEKIQVFALSLKSMSKDRKVKNREVYNLIYEQFCNFFGVKI